MFLLPKYNIPVSNYSFIYFLEEARLFRYNEWIYSHRTILVLS